MSAAPDNPRILILASDQVLGQRAAAALGAADIATALHAVAAPLSAKDLVGIDAVLNATTGSARAILTAARALNRALQGGRAMPRLVHLSSMTVYGSAEGLLDELSPTGENLNAYAAAHVAAEALARDYPATVVLRLGCEVGPGCVPWSLRIARLLSAHRLGDLGAQGDGICNLLYIEDLLAALKAALTRPGLEGGTFNLAMRSPPSWNEYLVRFAIALGAVPVSRIGQRRLAIESRFIAPPLKALELLSAQFLGGRARIPPPIPPSLLRDCRREVRLDVSAAEAALDLTSTPLDIALAAAAAWCATQRG